ncbi:MAG: hypothetical protein LC670_00520 [Flavobacteriales bacterium]|nr:hypothetical protein [Flavobacteriales bacterium]
MTRDENAKFTLTYFRFSDLLASPTLTTLKLSLSTETKSSPSDFSLSMASRIALMYPFLTKDLNLSLWTSGAVLKKLIMSMLRNISVFIKDSNSGQKAFHKFCLFSIAQGTVNWREE